jgi:hypothetical protein
MTAPKLPSKLWVGTYEIPVRIVPSTDPVLEGDCDGCFEDGEDGRGIYLASSLDKRKLFEVVIHEITHVIDWAYELEDEGLEEELVAKTHGKAWSQVYLDNPRLLRWFTHIVTALRKERSAV